MAPIAFAASPASLAVRGASRSSWCTRARSVRAASPATSRVNKPRMIIETVAAAPELSAAPLYLSSNPAALEALAGAFKSLNMPTWLVEWGHPGMMTSMILAMGMPGALIGWNGRQNEDKRKGVEQKQLHENIMIAFTLLAAFGGFGGTLSVVMQGYDIWTSPHALSAALVLLLLVANAVMAYSGFTIGNDGSPAGRLQGRTIHAYFGAATMAVFLLHGYLGASILLQG